MHSLTELLRGVVELEVRGAQPTRFLNACAEVGLSFCGAEPVDEFCLRLSLRRRDLKRAQELALRSQCTMEAVQERGAPRLLRRLKKRYLLLSGALLLSSTLLWSFLHVWELEVVGNERTSKAEILSALDRAGVRLGSFWPSFSNEQIKSRVLQEVPELSWLAVNVNGSRAVAAVRECVEPPELFDEKAEVEIVAEKAGLITDMQVLQGAAAVKPGQTVLPSELLVSGRVASSFEKAGTRSVHARAQVYARTWYTLVACAPLERMEKVYTGRERLGLALEFGRRRINFFNNVDKSGNPDVNYDKLSKRNALAVEGMFATPLALTVERRQAYTLRAVRVDETQLRGELEVRLAQRLKQAIGTDGSVTSQMYTAAERDGMLYVTLRAECVEDIAAERSLAPASP